MYIVTKDEYIPKNFKEKMDVKATFVEAIRDIRKENPIDLIVHTKTMHRRFLEIGSMFSRHLMQKGILLYEVDH